MPEDQSWHCRVPVTSRYAIGHRPRGHVVRTLICWCCSFESLLRERARLGAPQEETRDSATVSFDKRCKDSRERLQDSDPCRFSLILRFDYAEFLFRTYSS